jgi:hypothetical protein
LTKNVDEVIRANANSQVLVDIVFWRKISMKSYICTQTVCKYIDTRGM